ncbi:E3 ubiquitin-protein ligase RING1-like [Quillaja saponaria]|uniref:RING-type E3 ubiquitin transferase n=1 Tax=Quillaja saponaria TaxID=32244 RepID=A0AAD7VDQ6_QUISA|nr:E3 ubiquitin-protein ligase RING1-like [Quillaja saponaria]
MSGSTNTHWCYICRRPVRLRGRDAICPSCNGGFVQELDDMVGVGPLDFFGQDSDVDRDQRFRTYGSPVPFRLSGDGGIEALFNGTPGIGLTRGNTGDYFIGPGLEELFEHLSANDRRGPPPASRSSIDAMPTIKITQRHLRSVSHCPHNSCPVCRQELPPQGLSSSRGSNGLTRSNTHSSNANGRANQGRRNPFSYLWPFRSSNSSSNNNGAAGSSSQPMHGNSHQMGYSGWPFD